MKFFKGIGNFFKGLCKLTGRELLSLFLDLMSLAFATPSLFFNFFIVFYLTNPEMTTRQKGSAMLIIGVVILMWVWIVSRIKSTLLDDVKPFHRLIPRIIYKIRWFMILALVMWLYTMKIDLTQMFIYFGACSLTYSLSVIFRCCWLKANGKDWKYEYDKRTIKF